MQGKRLNTHPNNTGLVTLELDTEHQKMLNDKLFTALRKFGSGKKTRAVHKIVDKEMIKLAIIAGDSIDNVGMPLAKATALHAIYLNIYHYDDGLINSGSVKTGTNLITVEKEIKKEETFVSEARLHNIEKLQEKQKDLQNKLIKDLDAIKMVDGIYFAWLLFLADIAINQDSAGKGKIVTTSSDILSSILKKMYSQVKNAPDSDTHQLIEAISIYFIKIYYYGESASYALNSLKKAFGDEIIEAISRSKVTKFDNFNDLSKILKETELLPITANTFDLQMNKMFGKHAYETYIQPSLVGFTAYMANLAQPNQLFKDSYPVDDDIHARLEELLLNEQKKVTYKEK